ncbi:phenylacetate--CoA ligase [Rasiella rasia]|uniref:Phenylacetate--CoA ligase n=1 Tax=Rasiella rasia TaxID=2744027 RepID=A0A6G6GR62_9FLAO|nr:AMP-binding protein [Rasiella rasia]QIE60923.1 phenylacetate--CoA ligase [Rasiella rasia]
MKLGIATKSEEEIKAFQEHQLKETLAYVMANSAFYKRAYAQANVKVSDIQTLEDLQHLPVTTKDDLQQYNDDFFCVSETEIIDYVTTSGTMGNPVLVGLTDADLNRLAYNEALALSCSGITKQDTVQLMTTIDRRFMAGLAYFMGLRKLGASVIRVGSGVPELQWDSILKFSPTYLICVPSFLLKMIAYANTNGITISETSVKAAICIGEPIRDADFKLNALGKKIVSAWDIDLFTTYASTEMQTAFNECHNHNGGHLNPELLIAEILDEHNQPVSNEAVGELVITTLGVEGMPLVRFKTGDLVQKHVDLCDCGRNTPRLGPVIGRKQQMIKYKGTTIYPPAMYNVLQDFDQIQSFIIEIFKNDVGTDEIVLKVVSDDISETFKERIKDHFRAKLRVSPVIQFSTEELLSSLKFPKMSRKPVLLIDRR